MINLTYECKIKGMLILAVSLLVSCSRVTVQEYFTSPIFEPNSNTFYIVKSISEKDMTDYFNYEHYIQNYDTSGTLLSSIDTRQYLDAVCPSSAFFSEVDLYSVVDSLAVILLGYGSMVLLNLNSQEIQGIDSSVSSLYRISGYINISNTNFYYDLNYQHFNSVVKEFDIFNLQKTVICSLYDPNTGDIAQSFNNNDEKIIFYAYNMAKMIDPITSPPDIKPLNARGISCVRFNNDEIAFLSLENEVSMYQIDNDSLIFTESIKLTHNYAKSITIDPQKRWLIYETSRTEPQISYDTEVEKIIMRNLADNSERVLFQRIKYSE